jgi:hypothetical protein
VAVVHEMVHMAPAVVLVDLLLLAPEQQDWHCPEHKAADIVLIMQQQHILPAVMEHHLHWVAEVCKQAVPILAQVAQVADLQDLQ